METGSLKPSKSEIKNIYERPKKRIVYDATLFGFQPIQGDGKFVRICLLDSGCPTHINLNTDPYRAKDFTNSSSGVFDKFGHATAISGIIAANDPVGITGLAP